MSNSIPVTDGFSFRRIYALWRFNHSFRHMEVMLVASALLAGTTFILAGNSLVTFSIAGLLSVVPSFLLCMVPLWIVTAPAPELSMLLPASRAEKCVFVVCYTLVFLPLLALLPLNTMLLYSMEHLSVDNPIRLGYYLVPSALRSASPIQSLVPVAVGLWCACRYRTRHAVIIGVVAVMFLQFIVGFIAGIAQTSTILHTEGLCVSNQIQEASEIVSLTTPFLTQYYCACVVIIVTSVILSVRSLLNRQI